MNLTDLPITQVLQGKLKYHSARQAALAQNVANADTPNYKARDVVAPDFQQIAINATKAKNASGALALTDAQHMVGTKPSNAYQAMKRKTTHELNPNGNNVVIEEEMMNVAFNQSEYQRSLMLYRKMIAMMNTAIGKPNGQ